MNSLLFVLYLNIGVWVAVIAERMGFKMNTWLHKLTAILMWPGLQLLMLVVAMFTNE